MENINQVCRACLTAKDSFNYVLFQNVSPDIYCFCTTLEIFEDQELPTTLCDSCYDLLIQFHKFKTTCIESQKTLLRYKYTCKYEAENYKEPPHIKVETEILNENLMPVIIEIPIDVKPEVQTDNDYVEVVNSPDNSLNSPKVKVKRKVKKKKLPQERKHVTKLVYTCDVCHTKFKYLQRFEAHKLEHEGKIVPICCTPCNKTFVTWTGLQRHQDTEHTQVNLKTLTCNQCGKILKSQQTLKTHKKTHETRKPSVCHACGKGFTTNVILKAHLETHKENRERRFTCEHCGQKFYTNTMLMGHVSRQHSGRRYICHICSFPFTEKYNLVKHLRIHDGMKDHKCDLCPKSFGTQSTLVEHKRLHSGERPYACPHCPKAFVSKKRLTDHVRIHTGDKPHKCTVCDQRFTQRGTLTRHMKVHERIPSLS